MTTEEIANRSKAALKRINHRGPDNQGIIVKDNICFSHARLSILDPSNNGNQPLSSPSGRYIIVFNGEIYNHLKLREKYLKDQFINSNNDTITISHILDKYNIDFLLSVINGMFSIAIYDRKKQIIQFARDSNGEKPLYYHYSNNSICITSDIIITGELGIHKTINSESVKIFLETNNIPAPLSIFNEFKKICPGETAKIDFNTKLLTTNKINQLNNEKDKKIIINNSKFPLENLRNNLKEVLKDYTNSDKPLAFFLSGGVDSSLLTAIAKKELGYEVESYSVGFESRNYDESFFAESIAKKIGTKHKTIIFDNKRIEEFVEMLIQSWGEPFGDSSALPLLNLAEVVKKNHSVGISGDGGDELFYGYNRYLSLNSKTIKVLSNAPTYLKNNIQNNLSKLLPLMKLLKIRLPEQKIEKLKNYVLVDNNIESRYALFLRNSPHYKSDESTLENFISIFSDLENSASSNLEKIRNMDLAIYMPNDILQKVDISTMAYSLEARAPFLDPRIKDFADSIPIKMHINQSKSKILLKKLLEKYIPNNLIYRPKMGFGIPLAEYLLNPKTAKYIYNNIADSQMCESCNLNKILFQNKIKNLYEILKKQKESSAVYILWNIYILIKWFNYNYN